MKSLLITLLITGGLYLAYDLFVAAPETREVFSKPAEAYDPLAGISLETPPVDPLAITAPPEVSRQIEQLESIPAPKEPTIAPATVVQGEAPRLELSR
ncbi:hypothetical protein BH11VER1_BH11VER1_07530 [soil metagenome]